MFLLKKRILCILDLILYRFIVQNLMVCEVQRCRIVIRVGLVGFQLVFFRGIFILVVCLQFDVVLGFVGLDFSFYCGQCEVVLGVSEYEVAGRSLKVYVVIIMRIWFIVCCYQLALVLQVCYEIVLLSEVCRLVQILGKSREFQNFRVFRFRFGAFFYNFCIRLYL